MKKSCIWTAGLNDVWTVRSSSCGNKEGLKNKSKNNPPLSDHMENNPLLSNHIVLLFATKNKKRWKLKWKFVIWFTSETPDYGRPFYRKPQLPKLAVFFFEWRFQHLASESSFLHGCICLLSPGRHSSESRHVDQQILVWIDFLWIYGRAVITLESIWNRRAQTFFRPGLIRGRMPCIKTNKSAGSTGKKQHFILSSSQHCWKSCNSKTEEKSTIFQRQVGGKRSDLKMTSLN